MTLTLPLSSDLEQRLSSEAGRLGVAPADYAIRLLDRHLPAYGDGAPAILLLQSWIDAPDAEEQRETGNYLVRVLDADRPEQRKLFPPELEGVTW